MMRRVVTATGLQAAGAALGFVDRLVLSAFIVRSWGVAGFEDWSLLLAGAGLFNLLDFGLHLTFANAYTRRFAAGDRCAYRRFVSAAFTINLAIAALGCAALAGLILSGAWRQGIAIAATPLREAALAFAMMSVAIIVQTWCGALNTIYRSQGRFSRGLVFDLVSTLVRLAAMFLAVREGPVAVAGAYLAATILLQVVAPLIDQRRNLQAIPLALAWPRREDRAEILRHAPWFYAQHAANLFLLGLPTLALGKLDGQAGGVAVFVFSRTVVNLMRQGVQMLINSAAVELAQRHIEQGAASVQASLLLFARLSAVLAGCAVGALLPLLAAIFALLGDGQVPIDYAVAGFLAAGFLVTAPFTVVSFFQNFVGEARIGAVSRVAAALIAIAAGAALVQPFGAAGIAAGLALGEALGFGVLYFPSVARWTGRSMGELVWTWLWCAAASAAPCALVALAVVHWAPSPLAAVLAGGVCVAPLAAACLYFIGAAADQRRATSAAFGRLMRRAEG